MCLFCERNGTIMQSWENGQWVNCEQCTKSREEHVFLNIKVCINKMKNFFKGHTVHSTELQYLTCIVDCLTDLTKVSF